LKQEDTKYGNKVNMVNHLFACKKQSMFRKKAVLLDREHIRSEVCIRRQESGVN